MPEALKQTCDVPMLDVRAAPVAASYDEEARTVDFIASTGARGIRRQYWQEDYYEELEISESAIRMERLNNGASFLNSHNSWSLSNVLGSVQRAWIEDSRLMIRVKFSQREEVGTVLQDIRDGILTHVSVGYLVHQYDVTEKMGELDVRRAVDWEPLEVSLVPIAFDDAATARSADQKVSQAIINRSSGAITEEVAMTTKTRKDKAPAAPETPETDDQKNRGNEPDGGNDGGAAPAVAAPAEPEKVDARAAAEEAVRNERHRASEIRRTVRTAGLEDSFAETLIDGDVSIDTARQKIIERWAEQDQSDEVSTLRTGKDTEVVGRIREHAAESILYRGGVERKLSEGNGFGNMTLLRLCEDLLQREGVNVRHLSSMEMAARALSTSDLVHITGTVTNRTLLNGYESTPRTFVDVFRQGTSQDFREINRIRLSGAPNLEEVKEGGEFKYGKVTDEKESYALATYGKILPFTRQTIINDDLDSLIRVPMMFGRSAADLESDIVWNILIDNAALQDSVALFHGTHGNLGTAGAVSETTLDEMEQLMMAQTGMEGRLMNVRMQHLIVGPKQKLAAMKILTAVTPDSSSNVNVYQNAMDLTVEARLTGDAWYAAADYNQVDTVEFSYLAGNTGVYIETREGFTIDGIDVKARHDFAAKAIDYRGLYKNPGA